MVKNGDMKIGCVVMASGASARFGANKLLANFGGRPLLAHMLENLPRERLAGVVVVSAYEEVEPLARAHGFDHVAPGGTGLDDTVRAGIGVMRDMDGCMFCVGDQPLCGRASMIRLIDRFADEPASIVRLFSGDIPGNPILFPKRLFGALQALPPGKGGSWILRHLAESPLAVQADFSYELEDADTPKSLLELENRLHPPPG